MTNSTTIIGTVKLVSGTKCKIISTDSTLRELKCHSGRYRSVGRFVARICTVRIVATAARVVTADSEHLFCKGASVP